MITFASPARRAVLIGIGPAAGLLTAVGLYLAPAVDQVPPVVYEDVPTLQERRQGECAALLAEQPHPSLEVLAAAIAAEKGCTDEQR